MDMLKIIVTIMLRTILIMMMMMILMLTRKGVLKRTTNYEDSERYTAELCLFLCHVDNFDTVFPDAQTPNNAEKRCNGMRSICKEKNDIKGKIGAMMAGN